MSNYTKSTNFATKDSLPSGNPLKIVRGTEIDTEFNNIATAVNSKSDSLSPTFSGTVTTAALTVNGTATFNGSAVLSGFTSSTAIVNIGSGQVYKDVSGNLGIGTTSPATKLDVFGPGGVTSFTGTSWLGMRARGAASSNDYSGLDFSTQGQNVPTARIGVVFGGGGSSMQFGTSNSYGSGVTNTAVTINPSGNVGIGTNSPAANLDVRGASTFLVNATNPTAWLSVDAALTTKSMYSQFDTSSNVGIIGTYTNHPFAIYTNNTDRFRVRADGSIWTNANTQPVFQCRAWVNFDGTLSSPITPRASENVSSVTKAGTGSYTVSFTTAMVDANYSWAGSCRANAGGGMVSVPSGGTIAAGSIQIVTIRSDNSSQDFDHVTLAVFR